MTSKPIVRRKTSSQNQFLSTFSRHTPTTSYRDPLSSPFSNEIDSQSIHEGSSPNKEGTSVRLKRESTAPTTGPGSGAIINGPESLIAMVDKRTASWWYLRRAHDGNELWFHTIQITKNDIESHLEATMGQAKLRQRCKQLFTLGLSLSPLFDINSPLDLLRALNRVLDEWDIWSEGGGGKGMKNLFRGQRPNRRAGSSSDFGMMQDPGETSLVLANIPFVPDYFQTVISLCEIIRQLYLRIGALLGPSPTIAPPFPLLSTNSNSSDVPTVRSTGGNIRPPNPSAPTASRGNGSGSPRGTSFGLGKARTVSAMSTASAIGPVPGAGMGKTPWAIGTAEQVMRMDAKFKKLMITFAREMETIARKTVDEELACLLTGDSRVPFGLDSYANGLD